MITTTHYGTLQIGEIVTKYILKNKNGMTAEIINFGGIITNLTAKDKNGNYDNVVLGYQNPEDYFNGNPYYLGAIIGRYGNRIAKAQFKIEEEIFHLEANNAPNSLHGGTNSFHTKLWKAEIISSEENILQLTYTSPDGEEGFPGELVATVTYQLTENDELEITYQATTNRPTVVNMTQHTYFNLSGDLGVSILDHQLQLNCDAYLPTDETMIPTGELKSVHETAFDFRISKALGKDIDLGDKDLIQGCGYDHTFVINGEGLKSLGKVTETITGRTLEVFTTEPGVQLYTGNHLDGKKQNQQDLPCNKRTGFCLETQHFPDSPNRPEFPSTLITPEATYISKTIFAFK